MACHLCMCIQSPLYLGVWDDTVSNFIVDTQYWDLLLFIVQDRDEALETPPEFLLVG